ncbi:MAG TPA: hypothetical protein VK046_13435 [Actinomycetaceae bacterium]|nr:hypothetical protein [Actinomycetaceae bacterium]
MRVRQIFAVSSVVVLLSACSDDAPQDLTWEDSPLAEALDGLGGMGSENAEELERQEEERQRRVEDLVAACMAEQGFDYTPALRSGSVSVSFEDDDWGNEEWTAQYGYGVTTDPWADEMPIEDEWTDPNEDYVMSMSESEQEAYYAALHGEPIEIDEEDWEAEPQEYNWEDAGCYGAAQHEVYEEEGTAYWDDPAFAEFFEAANTLYEDAMRDPRVAEVNAEWAECMADADFGGMTTPDEAMNAIYEEYDRIQMEAQEGIDWENIDWEAVEESGVDPFAEALDSEAMDELRERELAMAMADYTCKEDLGTESRLLEIQFELEEEFVKTYQADIDALLAAYGQDS